MRYGIVARPRACAAALAVASAALLALASGASAETYTASNTAQFVEAVSKANANPGANTIVLAGGVYLPTATLTFTNTTGLQTVEGPSSAPEAKLEGGAVEPFPSELFAINASVSVTFKDVGIGHGGGPGVPAINDFGTLEVISSAIAGNTGPGIHTEPGATTTVRNTTLSDGLDFGLVDNGTASFFNSTVAFNKNGGVENKSTLNLTNTIVADNTGSGDCAGAANTSDHSLDSDGSCGVGALSKKNPLLQTTLVNNGGPTPTHALLTGSPAIDAGDSATCATTDQRGYIRPDILATACDIGAFEFYEPAHYYKNGVKNTATPTPVVQWGTLTLKTSAGGEVTCHTVSAGSVDNPASGAGVGVTEAFVAYGCESATCPSGETLKPEHLPWASHLEVEGTTVPAIIRTKVEGVKLVAQCLSTVEAYIGSLVPSVLAGTSALHPGFDEFGEKASTLLVEGSPAPGTSVSVEGQVKVLGYKAQELLNTKNP